MASEGWKCSVGRTDTSRRSFELIDVRVSANLTEERETAQRVADFPCGNGVFRSVCVCVCWYVLQGSCTRLYETLCSVFNNLQQRVEANKLWNYQRQILLGSMVILHVLLYYYSYYIPTILYYLVNNNKNTVNTVIIFILKLLVWLLQLLLR